MIRMTLSLKRDNLNFLDHQYNQQLISEEEFRHSRMVVNQNYMECLAHAVTFRSEPPNDNRPKPDS